MWKTNTRKTPGICKKNLLFNSLRKKLPKMTIITIKSYIETGMNITNFVKQAFYVVVGAAVLADSSLMDYFGDLKYSPLILGALAGVLYLVGCLFFGYLWDKWGMFHITNEWNNRRNDMIKEIRKNVKK